MHKSLAIIDENVQRQDDLVNLCLENVFSEVEKIPHRVQKLAAMEISLSLNDVKDIDQAILDTIVFKRISSDESQNTSQIY
jgi:hypothetical protein